MDKRALMMGVAIGAGIAGLVFAGVAQGQSKSGGSDGGRYQVVSGAGPQMPVFLILDTETGNCKIINSSVDLAGFSVRGGMKIKWQE